MELGTHGTVLGEVGDGYADGVHSRLLNILETVLSMVPGVPHEHLPVTIALCGLETSSTICPRPP